MVAGCRPARLVDSPQCRRWLENKEENARCLLVSATAAEVKAAPMAVVTGVAMVARRVGIHGAAQGWSL